MFRLLMLLLAAAAVAGYFTKPTEAQHREAVDAALHDLQDAAASNFDLGGLWRSSVAEISHDGTYTDYFVASRYVVSVNGRALAECWGAFTQVQCAPKLGGDAAAK